MTHELDEIDLKLLGILEEDSRVPYRDLASRFGVSVATVCNRIKKLEDLGVIKEFVIEVDYEKLGYNIRALVGITVDPKTLHETLSGFKKMDCIKKIYEVAGRYDFVLEVLAKDTADLRILLTEKMSNIIGVQRTETMVITSS
jgi:Lrp/AsnC family transcriptional regulator, regulator for asnA, asnC and gidA